MKTELTSIHGGFYLQRSKGTPQTLVIVRIAFCPRIRSMTKTVNPHDTSVNFEATALIFFAKSSERQHLSADPKISRVERKEEAGEFKKREGWQIREVGRGRFSIQFSPSIAITPASFLCITTPPS